MNTQFLNFEDNLSEIYQDTKQVTDDMQSLDGEMLAINDQTAKSGAKIEEDQRLLVIADNDSCVSDENKERLRRKLREMSRKEAAGVDEIDCEQSEHALDQAGSEMDEFDRCNLAE